MDRNGGKMGLPSTPKNVLKSSHGTEDTPKAPGQKNVVNLGSQKHVLRGDLKRDQ